MAFRVELQVRGEGGLREISNQYPLHKLVLWYNKKSILGSDSSAFYIKTAGATELQGSYSTFHLSWLLFAVLH